MIRIKKGFFILAFIFVFIFKFHYYDSTIVKAQEIKITIGTEDQKSEIEEQNTIYITIKEEEPRTIQIIIKEEEEKKEIQEEKTELPKNNFNPYGIIINSLTEQDKELICRVAYLEAGNQCTEGQRAVIEVILNRVISPKWPNTVEGVLSAPRQFSTWKHISKVSQEQVNQMNNILNLVYISNDTILPNNNYVYFNNAKSKKEDSIKIQGHWFWK